MKTIVIFDPDTRITYDNDAEAEKALAEWFDCEITVHQAAVRSCHICRTEKRTGYPLVTHLP